MNDVDQQAGGQCAAVGGNVDASIEVIADGEATDADGNTRKKWKYKCKGTNIEPNGDLVCTASGEYELKFRIKPGPDIDWVRFVELEHWPVVAGELVPGGTCPAGYDLEEFGPPFDRTDHRVKVRFKHVSSTKELAYRLNLLVKRNDGLVETVVYDPKIINK